MRFLIVHAHPEPKSFNGVLTLTATAALRAAGHQVTVSDLYAMRFNPVSDRSNFITVKDSGYFHQQNEEIHANENGGFAEDIKMEMDKMTWCEALIFQFPLWWFGLPAILKGWADRVLAMRWAYGGGRYYDQGPFAGKRAMCCVTTGNTASAYSQSGMNGPIDSILFPINHGILYFTGFTVVQPFVVYGPARLTSEAKQRCLRNYCERLLSLESAPVIEYRKLAEYDPFWTLRAPAKD